MDCKTYKLLKYLTFTCVIFGCINMGCIAVSDTDIIKLVTGDNVIMHKIVMLSIALCAIGLLLIKITKKKDEDICLIPSKLIQNHTMMNEGEHMVLEITAPAYSKIIYWTTTNDRPSNSKLYHDNAENAFKDYSNSGVSLTNEYNKAKIVIKEPTQYMEGGKIVPKRVFYRIVPKNGIQISGIRILELNDTLCKRPN